MKDQMKGHSPKLNTTAEEMFWLEKQTALVPLVSFLQKITIPQIWQTLLLATLLWVNFPPSNCVSFYSYLFTLRLTTWYFLGAKKWQ